MKEVHVEEISCSGDTHYFPLAAFSTAEKAEAFVEKLKKVLPYKHFHIWDQEPLPIDPVEPDEVVDIKKIINFDKLMGRGPEPKVKPKPFAEEFYIPPKD